MTVIETSTVINVTSTANISFKNDSQVTCVSRHTPSFLTFCIFPALAILFNVVILVAVLRKARKLMRQSHVYVHVSSTLVGNVLFSFLALMQILSLYFNIGGVPNDPNPAHQGVVQRTSSQWWTFHKSFLCGMFVIMCGNIGLLIDCIRHSTCSALRTAAGHRSHQTEPGNRWKKKMFTRRQRSYILVSLLWIIPIIYVVIPVGGWNCSGICKCLSECFPPDHIYRSRDYTCSRAFPPMANSWLAVVVLAWLGCLIATVYLLKRSVQRVTGMWAQCHMSSSIRRESHQNEDTCQSTCPMPSIPEIHRKKPKSHDGAESPVADSMVSLTADENSSSFDAMAQKPLDSKDDVFKEEPILDENNTKNENGNHVTSDRKYYSVGRDGKYPRSSRTSETSNGTVSKSRGYATHRRMLEHLRNTRATTFSLRYVIWLTVAFVLCTAPTMAILTIDMLNANLVLNMVVLNSCLMCPFIYCYICPFVLVKCLPGVKTSLSALILSVYSTTD